MKLNIKGMVSLRCILFVKAILDELCIAYEAVTLGEVELKDSISPAQRELLKLSLSNIGLELLATRKDILVEQIKKVIIEMVHQEEQPSKMKHSVHISQKLNLAYGHISKVFKDNLGISIEQYIIQHRIEKAKAMIACDQLNISEIAWRLHYSSVQHFSNQFRKVTGYPPSEYKSLKDKGLIPLDTVGLRQKYYA
jgi:AraC-like DNA-binding protein